MDVGDIRKIEECGRIEALKEAAVEQLEWATEQVKMIDSEFPLSDHFDQAILFTGEALACIQALRKET